MRLNARTRIITAAASAALFALVVVPSVGAVVATSSDAAGDAYKTAIAKAKEKRAAKLKTCAAKKGKAKRACTKGANKSFAAAKEKAKDAREDARYATKSPAEKAEQRHDEMREKHECLRETRSLRDCR